MWWGFGTEASARSVRWTVVRIPEARTPTCELQEPEGNLKTVGASPCLIWELEEEKGLTDFWHTAKRNLVLATFWDPGRPVITIGATSWVTPHSTPWGWDRVWDGEGGSAVEKYSELNGDPLRIIISISWSQFKTQLWVLEKEHFKPSFLVFKLGEEILASQEGDKD